MIKKRKIELMKEKKSNKSNDIQQRFNIIGILDARYNEEIRQGLKEDEAIEKAASKVKKDLEKEKESAVEYKRDDMIVNVIIQIDEVDSFLPKYMSEKEIEEVIDTKINQGNDKFGQLMGMLSKELKGKADMKQVSKVLKSKLG